jgi:hypothetical protein
MTTHGTKLTLTIFLLWLAGPAVGGELSADLSGEARLFSQTSDFAGAERASGSLSLDLEYYHDWYDSEAQIVVSPFARLDFSDDERTHFDLRELYWQKRAGDWEFSIGVRHVFWGVTEAVHLVDIINQTDLVENIDGEDKLGQPMVQVARTTDFGTFEAYWLPYFRERAFAGPDGRLRSSIRINTDEPWYESRAEKWHQDMAFRWFHTHGSVDIGLSYFRGTDRQPDFIPQIAVDGSAELRPKYGQTSRFGLDLLYVNAGWLWKLEAVTLEKSDRQSFAAVGGFEYTLVGIFDTRYDLGLLGEYLFDDRGSAFTPFEHDLFLGGRLALNDVGGTSLLGGVIIDTDNASAVALLELDRRLTDWWSLGMEVRTFMNQGKKDFLYDLSRDDLVQVTLIRHF